MAKIQHIAIMTTEPDKLADFYCDVFNMTRRREAEEEPGGARAVFISDGNIEVALIDSKRPVKGINHFGFTIDLLEEPEIREKLKKYGVEPFVVNPGRVFAEVRAIDPDGNNFDLSTTGLRLD
jgi:catechol 2,3-dioxygenase-like lactoylglutathione lyase family enzyme